jgi:hypothetical protein
MKPTEKRTEGAIYSFELREEKKRALELLAKCKRQCKRIKYIVKDPHTLEDRFIYGKS